MDDEASSSCCGRDSDISSLSRRIEEVGLEQMLSDSREDTIQDEFPPSDKSRMICPSQETSDLAGDLNQGSSPSFSAGKDKVIDSDQTTLKSIMQEESSNKDEDKGRRSKRHIKFDVYDVPGQSAAESFLAGLGIPSLGSELEHDGVGCDGPLCQNVQTYIKGQRYKCTVCDNVDFCLECVTSFYNNHDAKHAMVKCILPTRLRLLRDIDDHSKEVLISSCGVATVKVEDVMHVVYAETGIPVSILTVPESLVENLRPACFAIFRSNTEKPETHWIEHDPAPSDGREYVTNYKIDEAANVIVKHQPVGSNPDRVRDERVVHYQDAETLAKVFTGKISQFEYPSKSLVWQGAWAGRPVTRLIDLKPGKFEDRLECNIREVDLSEDPVYEALSYTWKETAYERANYSTWTSEVDETFKTMLRLSHAIYCGDSFLQINVGLRDALRRLRDPLATKTLWVDQLCIDQRNPSERSFQVQGMMRIYNRAKRVIVWVGDEDKDTTPAINIIRKLAATRHVSQHLRLTPEDMVANQVLDLPSLQSPDWKSFLNFFFRPVFGRMWVIQEIVVAQKVDICCGDNIITWRELASSALILTEYPWVRALSSFRDNNALLNSYKAVNIIMINGFREDFHNLRVLSTDRLLYGTALFDVSDPKDRIYSLLGIRSAKTQLSSNNSIQVDYTKSTQEVFTDATKIIITETKSFDVCSINISLSSKAVKGLPSWVPDYTSNPTCSTSSFGRPDPQNPYAACGGSEPVVSWPYKDQEHILVALAFRAGRVAKVAQNVVSRNGPLGPLVNEWTGLAARYGPKYVNGEFTPDAFWRTCIGDATVKWRKTPAPQSYYHSLVKMFVDHVMHDLAIEFALTEDSPQIVPGLAERWQSIMNPILGTLLNDAEAVVPSEDHNSDDDGGPTEARGAFFITCEHRKLFITEDHYFGIGPIDLQAGDEIYILSGAKVPFILRKLDLDSRSLPDNYEYDLPAYSMIGETYLHGLMKGEALSAEGFEWGSISIH